MTEQIHTHTHTTIHTNAAANRLRSVIKGHVPFHQQISLIGIAIKQISSRKYRYEDYLVHA